MEIIGNKQTKDLSQHELLKASLNAVYDQGFSTALWRYPNQSVKHQLIDLSPELQSITERIEDLGESFIFCSFDSKKKFAVQNHIHLKLDDDGSSFQTNPKEYPSEYYFNPFQEELKKQNIPSYYVNPDSQPINTTREQYLDYIHKGLNRISNEDFLKVVPARSKTIDIKDDIDVAALFLELCDIYPNAFVSMVSLPGHGTWIGASPESLISVDPQGIFSTVSLAGTQPYQPGVELYDMPWTQKEIEEQALVTRYIIDCFKKIRLREFEEHGPKTVKAGNLCHLRTDFVVNTIETNFKDLGGVMLELLHPTSAICGMPMEAAMKFILENEDFEREFFSGYMGPVNIENNIRLYVNLRCSQLLQGKAILYAGAGVTAYSRPQHEWEETELKCKTMENILSRDQ